MARFKFLALGKRVKLKVNGVSANTNTLYEETDNIKVEKAFSDDYGEPYDEISYKAFETNIKGNEIESNISKIFINFPPNKNIQPLSSDENITMLNSDTLLVMDHIDYNDAVDRIKILSYENVGDLEFFGGSIYSNKEIMRYDFQELKFLPETSGMGLPYQTIKYQVGNKDGYSTTVNKLVINIVGKASLLKDGITDISQSENNKSIAYYLKVSNGFVGKKAKIKITTSLSSNAFNPANGNNFSLGYFGGDFKITENGELFIMADIDQFGESKISTNISLNLENGNVTGSIKFTLVEVDGNALMVSDTNEQTLTII